MIFFILFSLETKISFPLSVLIVKKNLNKKKSNNINFFVFLSLSFLSHKSNVFDHRQKPNLSNERRREKEKVRLTERA